jgi:hypothetical protein
LPDCAATLLEAEPVLLDDGDELRLSADDGTPSALNL